MTMDFRLGDHRWRSLDEQRQEIKGFRREVYVGAIAEELTAIGMERECAETRASHRSPDSPLVFPRPAPDFRTGLTAPSRHVRFGRGCEVRDGWIDSPDPLDVSEF